MKPKPLYRSLIFWSGLFVMLFIGWAWQDSFRFYTGGHLSGRVDVTSYQGMVGFANAYQIEDLGGRRIPLKEKKPAKIFPEPVFLKGGGGTLETEEEFLKWSAEMEAAPDQVARARLDMRTFPPDEMRLIIPHWLVMLAVALPWAGLLIWRARRMSRAKDTLTAP